jgi:hypothetical protein
MTATQTAIFGDAAFSFLRSELERSTRTGREIHEFGVGIGDGSVVRWGEDGGGDRGGRAGVGVFSGSGAGPGLGVLAAVLEFQAESYSFCHVCGLVSDGDEVLS